MNYATDMNITFEELDITAEEVEEEDVDFLLERISDYLYAYTNGEYADIGFDVYEVNEDSVDICGIKYLN